MDTKLQPDKLRQKRWATKVRTGCITCRRRRIKCDEAKPACKRCITTGRACDGYGQIVARNSEPELAIQQLVSSKANLSGIEIRLGPPKVNVSHNENTYFRYFTTQLVPLATDLFDVEFWSIDLPQLANLSPSLWHACVSIAAIHQYTQREGHDLMQAAQEMRLYTFALKEYSESLTHLAVMATKDNLSLLDKRIMICAHRVFIGLAILRGDLAEACAHMTHGTNLLHKWLLFEQVPLRGLYMPSSIFLIDSLLLQYESIQNISRSTHEAESSVAQWGGCLPAQIPADTFHSPPEGIYGLEMILTVAVVQKRKIANLNKGDDDDGRNSNAMHLLYIAYNAWNNQLCDFKTSSYYRPEDSNAVRGMEIRAKIVSLVLDSDPLASCLDWDRFNTRFESIIELSAGLLRDLAISHASTEVLTSFGLTSRPISQAPGVTEGLFFIAKNCRHPTIRRHAISVLREYHDAQKTIDAYLFSTFASFIVDIEEVSWRVDEGEERPNWCQCVKHDFICAQHRIVDLLIKYPKENVAQLSIKSGRDILNGGIGQLVTTTFKPSFDPKLAS